MSVGQLLRTRRLELDLDVSDIAAETRIPARFLYAIEDDQHEKLPALPFAVGFVRNYAKMLGLSPDMVCAQFKAETSRLTPSEQVYFPEPLDESRIPSKSLVLGGVVVAVAALGVWWLWTGRSPDPAPEAPAAELTLADPVALGQPAETPAGEAAPAQAGETETAAAAETGADVAAAPETADAAPAVAAREKAEAQAAAAAQVIDSGPVIIRAVDDSWVRISDGVSGAVKIGIMKAGETYRVPALPNLRLMTGNAGAVEIQVGDTVLPPLGGRGEVIRNIDLSPAALRKLAQERAAASAAPRQ
ncbi:helix-turn-helix domain-containing protein [Pedomonas sp. V897]|uniref:helix-turn-helix domain-containing protein n=1 Tax=Pedomonas sp. V897 TaxID=3446482 RepID=UPI003EE27EEA